MIKYNFKKIIFSFLLTSILLLNTMNVYAYSATNYLNVTRYQQAKSNWCWIAVSQMLGKYYGNNVTQSGIAYQILGNYNNVPGTDSQVKSAIYYAIGHKYSISLKNNALSYDDMQKNISGYRPIPIKVQWNSGGAHAVIISGYDANHNVTIVDPYGNSATRSYSYDKLRTGITLASGTGRYILTWELV